MAPVIFELAFIMVAFLVHCYFREIGWTLIFVEALRQISSTEMLLSLLVSPDWAKANSAQQLSFGHRYASRIDCRIPRAATSGVRLSRDTGNVQTFRQPPGL